MNGLDWKVVLSTLAATALIGCGGGGGTPPPSGGGGGGVTKLSSLAGSVGDSSKQGRAILKIDKDDDGKFDGKGDLTLTVNVESGAFVFDRIETPEDKLVHGQLIVIMDGYAPFQKAVSLRGGQPFSIDASAALGKPSLKAVVKLGGMSHSARMNTVVQFGIQKSAKGLTAFSRLVSLSKLASGEVTDVNGSLSTYQFGLASFDDNVTLLQADMQAFDSTKAEDIEHFPGTFRGYGQSGGKSAADDEVGLQSAAFDMLVLTDQNGQKVSLKEDKMGASVDLSSCTNVWTRHLTAAQKTVISGWGDYDSSDPGFQVPIWSNDNSESAWKFVGVANYDDANSQFKMCIPDSWGSGYLNCDSPIAFEKPTSVCINAFDQEGLGIAGLSVQGNTASGEYANAYTDSNGHAELGLADSNTSRWSFSYRGAITGWSRIQIVGNPVPVNTEACDYELNVTGIVSPYTAEIKVTAKDTDNTLVTAAYVSLYSYAYGHFYSSSAITDGNGTATFQVEPNVTYTAHYSYGEAAVNVNGSVVSPETADGGAYADVTVADVNQAPSGHIYLTMPTVNKDLTSSMPVEFWANDANGDSITVSSIEVNGSSVTLTGVSESSSAGHLSQYGNLDISVLSIGTHDITIVVTDGSLSRTLVASFEIAGNRAPVIAAPLTVSVDQEVFYDIDESGTWLKSRSYIFEGANVYDPDGDPVQSTIAVDGNITPYYGITLSDGEHTATVTASDDHNHTVTKDFVFTIGNQPPVITAAGTFSNPINLSLGNMGTVYAYADDPDGDGVSSVTASSGSISQTLSGSGTYFWLDFNAGALGTGSHTITFVATDGAGEHSEDFEVNVTIINQNMPPEFYLPLYNQRINLGDTTSYPEIAIIDPEGDRMTLVCTVDGAAQTLSASATGMADAYQMSISGLSEGAHPVLCTATDAEGASSTSSATITVVDPSKEVALTVKTGIPNIVVTAHDTAQGFKMVKTGTTDAQGDVTLMLPAGTTSTSFSLAFDPQTIATADQVFKDKKGEVLQEASNHCQWSSDLNISECATADWCALLADTDSVPTWVVDAAQLKDKDDNNITGASVDSDSNGEISITEFYQATLRVADKDSNGNLTWAELDEDSEVDITAFVGVPVKTYEFNLTDDHEHEQYFGEGISCSNLPAFDINVTNASGYVGSINIYGTGYGYAFANGANTFTAHATTYRKDSNGKYDYAVHFYDEQGNLAAVDLLLDKTAADLSSARQYDAISLPALTTKDVNITNDVAMVRLSVSARYKGVDGMGHTHTMGNGVSRYFYDNRLRYTINADEWLGTATMEKSYEQHDYYGDGTLRNTYKASDYPMLDIDANVSTGTVVFSGADTGKVTVSKVFLRGYMTRASGYGLDGNYEIEFIRYGDPVSDFNFTDLNVSEIFPATIATRVEDAMNSSTVEKIKVKAYEYKGKTAEQILGMKVAGDYAGFYALPRRSFRYKVTLP